MPEPRPNTRSVILPEQIPWLAQVSRRKRWLVGVSGGADSVALLHLLVDQRFANLIVCHLDHRLRGRASTEDANFVRRLAEKLGLKHEIGRADVAELMAASGESMETAARNARHAFFAQCSRKYNCRRIILAHHADDQAETVLWNLLRGSHGLKGMRTEQTMVLGNRVRLEISRPLLAVRRTELFNWLASRGHRWREDASNAQPVAIRNRLRNEAVPLLSEISGRDATLAILRGAADAEDQAAVEAWAVKQARASDPQGRLHLQVLRTLPPALKRAVIADFLKSSGISGIDRNLVSRVVSLLDPAAPPAVNLPGGGWIRRRAGRLLFVGADIEG